MAIFRLIHSVNRDTWKYSKFKAKKLGIFLNSINNIAKTKSLKLGRSEW